ncbi:unnamed protein product [Prorocentrum cordatum]|uniref:Uncharacterized protein n=1 Tax=Prorocentrum cordatum TaxID=2364126 RepID=A0ABN9S6B8_9DINO|nr:unnamed protein product [Polarella glacialis]
MYPKKKKNDASGIYVKLDHALLVGGIKDRARRSSRRRPGWDYVSFPAPAANEGTGVLEKALERPLEAELYLSNAHGYGASLSWFRSGLAGAWSTWSWGSTVGFAIFSGGAAVSGNLWRWMRWVMEELEDGHHSLLVADYVRGDWRDLYLGGRLETSIMIFTASVALGPSLWSCCRQMSSPRLAGEPPPGIAMDSDGEAGPSRAGPSDESMPAKGMQDMPATGSNLFDKIIHPREQALADLGKIDALSTVTRLAGTTSPVAQELRVQTYGADVSLGKFATDWVRPSWPSRDHLGHQMRLHRMKLDRRSEASPEISQTARYENLRARVYALTRAFEDVTGIIDGKQPRDSGADKWMSRACWDPADELDWRSLTEGEEALARVERYLTARLQQRGLQHTYPQMEGSDAATEEDEQTGGWPFLETETLCRAGRCCPGRAGAAEGAGPSATWERATPLQRATSRRLREAWLAWGSQVAAIKVDEGVVVSVDAGESARPPPETNPARTVDICPLATEDLPDGTGRMPRKPNPAMEEESKGPKVYRDSSFRSRTFLPILVEKPWDAGMLRTTDELVEGMPLFGVIQKGWREEADPLGPVRRQVRAIWDWRRANLRWQTPMHGPLGSSATLTNLDLSNLGEADVVYTGVGVILDRFDRFETPPDVWLYFVLEGLPLHEFFDYMRTTRQGYVIPCGGPLLAVKVLVKGRPWPLPLAYSRPKALTARRLWADTGDARLVHGAPTHQRGDRVVGCGHSMPTLHCLGQNRSHLWPDSGGAGAGGADMLDPGATGKLWAWAAISQRMGFAIRGRIYREMRRPEAARTPFCLPDAARWGLTTMACCATLRHTDLEAPWLSQVSMTGMTESKDNGHGVAVTEASLEEIRTATGYTEIRGVTIATDLWVPHVWGRTYGVDELADASATPPPRVSRRVDQALYLFAGRRREGDLEEAIYARAECDGYDIQIWSIGSVIEPKHDRPNDELVSAIRGQTRDGHFHAVIAPPPCPTWSRACFPKERPRPPRTRLEPWGRSDILLTTFEHLRLDLGSRLLLTAMQAVREVCRTGGPCLTDHSADPEEDLYTAIGNPPEKACLGEEAGGQLPQIEQGRYGASPMESTMKGIFGVYDDALDLAVGRLRPGGNHRGRHPAILEGRVERGRPDICTAAAQAFQPPRCATRGRAILEALARMTKEIKGPDPACAWASPATTPFGPPRPGGAEIEIFPAAPCLGATCEMAATLPDLTVYATWATQAWDNYEKETHLGIREGGSTRRFTRLVADVITAQWAPKVRDILSSHVDKGWGPRCKSAMGHALADYRDIKSRTAWMPRLPELGGPRTNYSKQQRQPVDSNKTNMKMKKVKEVATELATTGWWRE